MYLIFSRRSILRNVNYFVTSQAKKNFVKYESIVDKRQPA